VNALQCKKDAFSLDDVHYLNCAYMAPFSKAVQAAGEEGIRRRRVPGINLTRHHFFHHSAARHRFARLINAPSDNVAITPASSYGLSCVAKNLRPSPRQNVVTPWGEMPSDYLVWERLCAETGATLRVVHPGDDPRRRADDWNERLIAAIDEGTALVFACNVHWLDGTLFDLAAIQARCQEVGAALVVDATQSVGALPIDVESLHVDALVSAGYKWLLGPYAHGVAYFGPRFRDGVPLEENWVNRELSVRFEALTDYQTYRPGAARFDYGEAGNFVLSPMLSAALDQLLEWGVENIADYNRSMTRFIGERVQEKGFAITPADQRAPHYIGIKVDNERSPAEVLEHFQRRGVVVSMRGGYIRVTPNVYNDMADAEAFIEALTELKN
jgi:selenocysteine lyase/cysteine desulfurase